MKIAVFKHPAVIGAIITLIVAVAISLGYGELVCKGAEIIGVETELCVSEHAETL